MNPDILDLKQKVQYLIDTVAQLQMSANIEAPFEDALTERLSNTFPAIVGTSTAGTPVTTSVPAGGGNVTVPANPSGSLKVMYNGTPYFLLTK